MQQRERGQIKGCIQLCDDCELVVRNALYHYFLEVGEGIHSAQVVDIMTDCIRTCRTAADFMLRDSVLHTSFCALCAIVCEACAKSCDHVGTLEMDRCAEICRECAKSCQQLAARSRAA